MMSTFHCVETDQRLNILDYDVTKTNVRYKAVINDNQIAVLHQQNVDTKNIPVSDLSLCPGLLEAEILKVLFQSPSDSATCTMFLIENFEDKIVYRSRRCLLLYRKYKSGDLCASCSDLLRDLKTNVDEEIVNEPDDDEMKYGKYFDSKLRLMSDKDTICDFVSEQDNVECDPNTDIPNGNNVTTEPIIIRIMKKEKKTENNPEIKKKEKKFHHHGVKCPFCDKRLRKNSPGWPIHLRGYHQLENQNPLYQEIIEKAEGKKWICHLCGSDYGTFSALGRHMVAVHDTHLNTVNCEKCGSIFKNEDSLREHIKRIHESPSEFLCGECGKISRSKCDLKMHINIMHQIEKVDCKECGRSFACKFYLVRHIKKVHSIRKKTEKCNQCEMEFYNMNSLKSHIFGVHEKLKPWYCEFCDFKCSRLGNLNLHRRKSHNQPSIITRKTIIQMVENEQHLFYTKDDLSMILGAPH